MHVNSICKFEEKDLAISSHWVMSQWTSLTTEVTLDQSKPHLVSRGSKYCHSTPVPTQLSSSWTWTSKIQNHRPVVECAKYCARDLNIVQYLDQATRSQPTAHRAPSDGSSLQTDPAGFSVHPPMTVALSPWLKQLFVVVVVGIVPARDEAPKLMGGPVRFHVAKRIESINCVKKPT